MKAFKHYTSSVGARMGITRRVIITDGGDCTNAESAGRQTSHRHPPCGDHDAIWGNHRPPHWALNDRRFPTGRFANIRRFGSVHCLNRYRNESGY
jgi:hypothetical protein